MAMTVKGCLTAQLQHEGAEEPETDPSVHQQKVQEDAANDKVIKDYKLDVDYKTEGSDPEIVDHVEEKVNSHAEFMKMEPPHQGSMWQRLMNCKVTEQIQCLHQA